MRTKMLLVMVAFTALPASVLPVVPAAAETGAVLWAGQVVDAGGSPAEAQVVAALRPPPSSMPTAEEYAAGVRAPGPLEVASTRSGRDGRFALRGRLPAVPAEYRSGQWVHLVVSVRHEDGSFGLAFDSVPLRQALTAGAEATEDERPAVIRLGAPASAATGDQASSGGYAGGPGKPWVGCDSIYVESRENANRTIADIDVEKDWSFEIHYQETDTTAWQVGYSETGDNWSAGGSVSFDSSRGAGFDAVYGPYGERFREHYQINLTHAKVKWRCGKNTSPGPFYVYSVEPERWTGGTYNQGDPKVVCGRDFLPVAGHTLQWRHDGTTSTYSASGGAYGFTGGASVQYSKSIRLGWKNHQAGPRLLCGESADPVYGDTRVRAIDF